MRKILYLTPILIIITAIGIYFLRDYWIHRFDEIIAKQAVVYRLDKYLVWSIIFQETYFREERLGTSGEIGLMQVTPLVAKQWAKETGIKELENEINSNLHNYLINPEQNIRIGCWYLEKLGEKYRDKEANVAMTLAAYNAGPSRVEEWTKDNPNPSEEEFINNIDISTTKAYVSEIIERYRILKAKSENEKLK
jgi:soluble lytic murein transglycosylase